MSKNNSKEPIWSIPEKCRAWFCVCVLLCVIVVSVFTWIEKRNERWIEIFTSLGVVVVSSVCVVWVLFIAGEQIVSVYQRYQDKKAARFQKIREEEQVKQVLFEQELVYELRREGFPEEVIRRAINRAKKRVRSLAKDD